MVVFERELAAYDGDAMPSGNGSKISGRDWGGSRFH
jgi:hypothetical protein